MEKEERFRLFICRLESLPPAASAPEAAAQLAAALNEIEDLHSGVMYAPENWVSDGRMYPPQNDRRVRCTQSSELLKYRSKGHFTYFAPNGAIRIETINGPVLLDKPGADGRTIAAWLS